MQGCCGELPPPIHGGLPCTIGHYYANPEWTKERGIYGERKGVVEAEDWDGPAYQTCRNAASICDAFELSRRRDSLSFKHHAEVAALAPAEADALLDWAEEPIATTGKPRPTRELRAEVSRHKPPTAQEGHSGYRGSRHSLSYALT
jgi:hypothetical protein